MVKSNEDRGGYGYLIDWIVYIGDLCIINGLFAFLYYFVYDSQSTEAIAGEKRVEAILLINLVYFITSLFVRHKLSANIIPAETIVQQAVYFIALYTIILTASYSLFNTANIPFTHFFLIFLVLCIVISIWHVIFRNTLKAFRKRGYNYKNIIIVGGDQNAAATYRELKATYSGYKILGFFENEHTQNDDLPQYLGKVDEIIGYLGNGKIDEIYCTLPGNESERIAELITYCEKNMIRFHLVPDLYKYVKKKLSLQFLETIPILSLRLEPLQHPFNRLKKRSMDIFFSLLVIIFVYPILYLIIAPIIKLSSRGPIHFVQKRTGIKGQEFNCLKFRSMKPNSDANKKSATKGDPRITKIGAFMRKTSIDELPQFINVLKGDMSVVGPRPHMLKHTEEYSALIEKFMVRHLVKPGITGWAQTTGSRGETKTVGDMEERVKKDVWYLENWSLFLDFKIMVHTVLNVFQGEDQAY